MALVQRLLRKTVKLVFLASLFSLASCESSLVQSLSGASIVFGRNIFNKINPPQENIVFSPYSLHSALTMTSMGASGDTLNEMRTVLGLTNRKEADINQAYKELILSFNKTEHVDVLSANAIFQNPKFTIKQDFKDLVKSSYYAVAKTLDFTSPDGPEAMVNKYVQEKTKNMIKNFLKPHSLKNSTKLVLINALFFNGSWAIPFTKASTENNEFHVSTDETVQVNMMTTQGAFRMKQTETYRTLQLPFYDGRFAMYIVIPNRMEDFTKSHAFLPTYPEDCISDLTYGQANIFLPKFKLDFQKSLVNDLKALGMRKVFTRTADLSRMSPSSMVSDVIHQAVIDVTESGTTASAATAVVVVGRGIPSPDEVVAEFRVDKPFFFFLRDDVNKEILFQGKVTRPSSSVETSGAKLTEAEHQNAWDNTEEYVKPNGNAASGLQPFLARWSLSVFLCSLAILRLQLR